MSRSLDFFDRSRGDWRERLDFMVETMREVSRHTDPESMVRAYSERMRRIRGGRLLSLTRRGVEPPRYLIARDSSWKESIDPWKEREKLPVLEGGVLGEVMYANEARLIEELELAPDDPAKEILRGYRSLVALPIFDGGEALNVVVFLRKEGEPFDPETLPELVWTSNLFGRATHNLVLSEQVRSAYEMVERELKDIAEIQRALLPPSIPAIPGLDVAVHYEPARRAGGDYYDFLALPGGGWGLLIADVSGHGAPAAVEMAITRTLAHLRADSGAAPDQMLGYLNEHLCAHFHQRPGGFVTAFFGAYDPPSRTLRYASAGHPAPRVRRCRDGSLLTLGDVGGLPLGILPGKLYEQGTRELVPGDQVVFFTDGITEAFDADGEQFGTARLDRTLEDCGGDAADLVASVLAGLEAFTRGRERTDDVTLVVARVTG
jgi:sigma-B regulation protein RsbU (phosphoserine phosphatase)